MGYVYVAAVTIITAIGWMAIARRFASEYHVTIRSRDSIVHLLGRMHLLAMYRGEDHLAQAIDIAIDRLAETYRTRVWGVRYDKTEMQRFGTSSYGKVRMYPHNDVGCWTTDEVEEKLLGWHPSRWCSSFYMRVAEAWDTAEVEGCLQAVAAEFGIKLTKAFIPLSDEQKLLMEDLSTLQSRGCSFRSIITKDWRFFGYDVYCPEETNYYFDWRTCAARDLPVTKEDIHKRIAAAKSLWVCLTTEQRVTLLELEKEYT